MYNRAPGPTAFVVRISFFVMLLLLLTACGRSRPEPTATPTKTAAAEEAQSGTAVTATATPEADNANDSSAETDGGQSAAEPNPTEVAEAVTAIVTADLLNVRAQPNQSATINREIVKDEQFEVVGRTADSSWVSLAQNGQSVGWSAAEFLTILGDLDSIAVVAESETTVTGQTDSASQSDSESGSSSEPAPVSFAPATMSSPDFGAQAFLWWREEVADRDLKLMQEAGFNWVKQAFAWETIEAPSKGQFDWSIADRVVRQVNAYNLKLLARLSSDPDLENFWAGHPPQNGANFADFAFELARRYSCSPDAIGCIQAFQIWNEPNLAREWGNNPPNPAQYAQFLQQAYAAIKRGNPNAIVISAGMAPTGTNSNVAMPDDVFYDQMYGAMGSSEGYFDMLGVHGAGFAAPPELDPAQAAANQQYGGFRFFAFRHVEDIRAIMERYGDSNKRIVLLEFGWTYDPVNDSYKWHGAEAGIDASIQGDYLRDAYRWAASNWQPWIGLMSLLTMPNLDWLNDGNPQDEEQYWWAIMEPSDVDSLSFRPAYIKLCNYFNEQKGQICIHAPK